MRGAIEDHEEIRQLIARYCHLVDSHQAAGWAALFTEEGVLDAGGTKVEGIQALESFAESLRGVYETHPMRHVVTNVVIDINGDDARSQSYIQVLNPGPSTSIGMTGIYDDILRRVDGEWRFVQRRMTPDVSLG